MLLEKHDLLHEFPEHKEKIHQLKISDRHFARLFDEYHEVNKQVVRFEQEIEHCSDQHLETVKKQRLHLKDQLYQMLTS
ncbi:YdcH family protein [Endozoicomonadaceae bacterium StTr2]